MIQFLKHHTAIAAVAVLVLVAVSHSAFADWRIARPLAAAHVGQLGPQRTVVSSGDATGLDSAFWTGWIDVRDFCEASLEVTFTDANDSVTNVVMRCEESTVSSTAEDAGADICCRSIAAGVETYTCPCDKKADYTNSGTFGWTVENLRSLYINCEFDAEGTAAAADTVAWKLIGEYCR